MPNERLRSCIAGAQLTPAEVATQLGVDPKTVERWIEKDRLPHREHRLTAAALLRTDEAFLWPKVLDDARRRATSEAEFVTLYPTRGAVPAELWQRLIEETANYIDVLVYAGLFLPDGYPDLAQTLISKAKDGAAIRMALGDPDSEAVRLRGEEEGIGEGMAARVRLSMTYLRAAIDSPDVQIRLHQTALYNSLYRFDDDLLVNTHVYGAPAAQSPVMHLRQLSGGRLFQHYQASFERVWGQAKPVLTVVEKGHS